MRFLITLMLVCCTAPSALAEKMLFNIDLSGNSDIGNELSVFGSFRIDPAAPIDNSNIGLYSLFVQRNDETPARSLSFFSWAIPNDTLGTVQMIWSLVGDDLYVSRTSAEDSSVTYVGFNFFPPQPTASFNLGSGTFEHSITYGDASGYETAVLKGVSGADGPNGFRVGTLANAVPEPSSLVLGLTGAFFLAAFTRRRRT